LDTVYKSKSNARRLRLRRQLTNLRKESPESLTKFFDRARTIWRDLLAAGQELKSTELVCKYTNWYVLAGLRKEYEVVVAIFEATDKELELDDVLARLLSVEQRVSRDNEGDVKVLYSKTNNKHAEKVCYYCGKKGHIKANCFKRQQDEKEKKEFAGIAVAL
jgi:hypothetical protein